MLGAHEKTRTGLRPAGLFFSGQETRLTAYFLHVDVILAKEQAPKRLLPIAHLHVHAHAAHAAGHAAGHR